MNVGNTQNRGFTIVELLIVVVVIAILAAITIVSYVGITNQAYDSSVQSDVRNLASQVLAEEAKTGVMIAGGGGANAPAGLTSVKVSRDAYDSAVHNVYYCANTTTFGIAAKSKSGKVFFYTKEGGLTESSFTWTSGSISSNICAALGVSSYTFSNGYDHSTGWRAWADS